MKIKKIAQSAGVVATVVDNLESNSATDALSAKQGKILNKKIEEVTLYNNETGSTSNITLNDSVENYEYIEIFYGADNRYFSNKIYNANNKHTAISAVFSLDGSSTLTYIYTSDIAISNKTLTISNSRNAYINLSDNTVGNYGTSSYIKIYRVVGHNKTE